MNEIAIASVPVQEWETPLEPGQALKEGCIFSQLHKPFFVEEQMQKEMCCEGQTQEEESLREIQWTTFFLIDLQLFLDTHPDQAEARALQQEYQQKRKELMTQFAREHYPLTMEYEGEETKAPIPWEGGGRHVAI